MTALELSDLRDIRPVETEAVELSKSIESNAIKLRALNDAIQDAFRVRHESDSKMEAWQSACREFHFAYDKLAFPGGLGSALERLRSKDPTFIEEAVQFIEADPWFFRSGYIKEEILKHLRGAPFTQEQRTRLRQVLLSRVRDKANRREFRSYCRLALALTDADFEKQMSEIAAHAPRQVAQRAQWVLDQLKNPPPKKLDW